MLSSPELFAFCALWFLSHTYRRRFLFPALDSGAPESEDCISQPGESSQASSFLPHPLRLPEWQPLDTLPAPLRPPHSTPRPGWRAHTWQTQRPGASRPLTQRPVPCSECGFLLEVPFSPPGVSSLLARLSSYSLSPGSASPCGPAGRVETAPAAPGLPLPLPIVSSPSLVRIQRCWKESFSPQ